MSNGFEKDKKWSDQFMPEIKSILGRYLIGESTREEDQLHNTDLIVLRMDAVRITCRVRKPGYFEKYGDDFTIRSKRPNGNKTELTKIVEGWGDYMFYAHAGEGTKLSAWGLGDLKVFRLWFNRNLYKGKGPWNEKSNTDNSSDFLVFKWAAMPREFIVGHEGLRLKIAA